MITNMKGEASAAFERGQIRAIKSKCEMNKWKRASKRTTEIPKTVQQPNAEKEERAIAVMQRIHKYNLMLSTHKVQPPN